MSFKNILRGWYIWVPLIIVFMAFVFLRPWFYGSKDKGVKEVKKDKEGVVEKVVYPQPRFLSYLKTPRSVEEIMPHARSLVSTFAGGIRFGIIKPGQTVAIVVESVADDMVVEAIKRALEERGVKVKLLKEWELVGVSREEALQERKTTVWHTAEHGYMEAQRWIRSAFANPDVPKKWIEGRRPDLYNAIFPKIEIPDNLKEVSKKFSGRGVIKSLLLYLDANPEVDWVLQGKGGRTSKRLGRHGNKGLGNFYFDTHWDVMNKAATFPGDVLKLVEERTTEPLAWSERVHVTDPEGTNVSFDLTVKEAELFSITAYQPGHLNMAPLQGSGRYPFSKIDYPATLKEWAPPNFARANGVIAATNNHTGSYPRVEVHLKDGYITEVRGGGLYGELWREFLKYPFINDLTYPYVDRLGYWWLYEGALGTHPKFFKRPDENLNLHGRDLANSTEHRAAGVIHWGFGLHIREHPDDTGEPIGSSKKVYEFAKKYNLPWDHWWHLHNLLPTYKVRIRATDNWVTLVDKGRITAFDNPETRALSSRYGNPDEILDQDWRPHLPGINAPGRYEDYAQNPWKTQKEVIDKVLGGTYEYFYPPLKTK